MGRSARRSSRVPGTVGSTNIMNFMAILLPHPLSGFCRTSMQRRYARSAARSCQVLRGYPKKGGLRARENRAQKRAVHLVAAAVHLISIKEWVVPTPGSRPHDPLATPDNAIWYTGQFANVLGRLDPQTGQITEYRLKTPHAGPH